MTVNKQSLTGQLRTLIDQSGVSRYRIAKEAEIDQATLSRFMSSKGGISIETFDAIGNYLNLLLIQDKSPLKRKKKGA